MERKNIDESNRGEFLRVYIPGRVPTIREIQYISGILECSLAWSTIALLIDKGNKYRRYIFSGDSEKMTRLEKEEQNLAKDITEKRLSPLNNSYETFLIHKYRPLFERVLAECGYSPPHIVTSERSYTYSLDKSAWFVRFLNDKHFGGPDFNFQDFNLWLGEEFRTDLIITNQILTTNSLELYFDLGVLLGILSLQSFPLTKDIVVYTASVIKEWMGKGDNLFHKEIRLPELSSSYRRLVEQYDDVEIRMEKGRFALILSRNKNSE